MALAMKHGSRYGFEEEGQGVSGSKEASRRADSFSLSARTADDSVVGELLGMPQS
jgi:hypothetical protein